eukprot:scaffold252059_cov28-Tisochrysis_lutea.AAC.3
MVPSLVTFAGTRALSPNLHSTPNPISVSAENPEPIMVTTLTHPIDVPVGDAPSRAMTTAWLVATPGRTKVKRALPEETIWLEADACAPQDASSPAPGTHLTQSPSSTFCPANASVTGTPTSASATRGASMVLGGSSGGDDGGTGGVGGGFG